MSTARELNNNNVIQLTVIDGKLSKKEEVKYKKDGGVKKSHTNKVAGISSTVYPFVEDEIERVVKVLNKRIEEATNDSQRQIAWRNKMLFLVGINLSLRVSDLVSLKWNFFLKDDMTFQDFYKIQPKKTRKTGKFVTLYFNEVVRKIVLEYIKQYPIEDMNSFIFKSREGNGAITEGSVWKIITDLAIEAGIKHPVGSHSLRKSFGYHVWHNAEDKEKALILLQVIFNHSSPATTKKYIGVTDEEVEDVFNELNLGIDLI